MEKHYTVAFKESVIEILSKEINFYYSATFSYMNFRYSTEHVVNSLKWRLKNLLIRDFLDVILKF